MPKFALNYRGKSLLSKQSQNSFEHNFILKKTFKRNKRYLNLSKINKQQQQQQKSRRKPLNSTQNLSVDEKINTSFMNTTVALSDKVQQNIHMFKNRMSAGGNYDGNQHYYYNHQHQQQYNQHQYQHQNNNQLFQNQNYTRYLTYQNNQDNQKSKISRSYSSKSKNNNKITNNFTKSARNFSLEQQQFHDNLIIQKKKIRGMALDKYCSRQQYYQNKQKNVNDQRLFNNFSLQKPDLTHTKDFQKYLQRDLDFKLNNINLNLQYNTQQLYQDYYYNKNTMQCNFNYKTQKRTPRKYFQQKRKQDQPATQLSPQKVKQSYQKTLKQKKIDGFYANSGRELPCQLDQRINTPLTNHWVDQNKKIKTISKQYNVRKMKEDLIQKKLQQVKQKKIPKFQRNQICDQIYFRIQKA